MLRLACARGSRCVVSRRLSSTTTDLAAFGTVLGGAEMDSATENTFVVWHSLVEDVMAGKATSIDAKSMDSLRGVVADDCVFKPPTYFKPWVGGDETTVLLSCAAEVFGDSFTYKRQFLSPNGRDWALEFHAMIGDTGVGIDGIDLVSLDDRGKMKEFAVLARPPNGVAALKALMMKKVPPRMVAYKARRALGF